MLTLTLKVQYFSSFFFSVWQVNIRENIGLLCFTFYSHFFPERRFVKRYLAPPFYLGEFILFLTNTSKSVLYQHTLTLALMTTQYCICYYCPPNSCLYRKSKQTRVVDQMVCCCRPVYVVKTRTFFPPSYFRTGMATYLISD